MKNVGEEKRFTAHGLRRAPPRAPNVFIVGFLALVSLWIPTFHLKWEGRPFDFHGDYVVVPLLVIYALWVTFKTPPSLEEYGLTGKNFWMALRYLSLPTLAGALILGGIGFWCKSLRLDHQFWKRFLLNSAIFQQIVVQVFFHRQLAPWFGAGRKTAGILAIYFCLLHAPNPALMLGTLLGMYFWARCYQLYPNLYVMALSQAWLAALLMHSLPPRMLPTVSVGWRFVEKVWLKN